MKRLWLIIIFPIFFIYMIYKAHHDKVSYHTIVDSKLPDELNDYCIFFISDIHRRRVRNSTLKLINNQVDAVIIGGDLTEKFVPLLRTKKNIQELKRWNVPICFVWGNNDEEINMAQFETILKEEGVYILSDNYLNIHRGSKVLQYIGLDYPLSYNRRKDAILNGVKSDFSILLTHIPISYSELSEKEKEKVNVILAAHTHGGQIRIFDLGPFENGSLIKYGNTSVLVSEGYGYSVLPFRLGTDAECHVITLRNH